jgi:uncharacterized protein involved in type VI secretion and phage assembly
MPSHPGRRRGRYLGKYRGTVTGNLDPLQIGRLQVRVPDIADRAESTWAMPCFPMAGAQSGVWVIPPVGAGVWVEFERGDLDHPIWTGCFYGAAAEVPAMALTAAAGQPNIVIQTSGETTLMLSDTPGPAGGILLKTSSGAMIAVNQTGIILSNGKGASVILEGPTVTINDGALTVT